MLLTRKEAEAVAWNALAAYDLGDDASLTFVKQRENIVFRVVSPTRGSFALRLHRPGYRTDAQLLAELRHMERLNHAGVPLPTVELTSKGDQFCRVGQADGSICQVDLLTWVDASPMGDVGEAFAGVEEVDPAQFFRLGRALAGMHSVIESWPVEPLERAAWDLDGLFGVSPVWGDPMRAFPEDHPDRAVLGSALVEARSRIAAYGRGADRFGAIHADCTPENVLLGAEGLYIIDFDDFGEGWFLFDLATVIFFYGPHPRRDEVTQALLAGYQTSRALSDGDWAVWDAFVLARGATYLAWAADRRGDETAEFILSQVRPYVTELASALLSAPAAGELR